MQLSQECTRTLVVNGLGSIETLLFPTQPAIHEFHTNLVEDSTATTRTPVLFPQRDLEIAPFKDARVADGILASGTRHGQSIIVLLLHDVAAAAESIIKVKVQVMETILTKA